MKIYTGVKEIKRYTEWNKCIGELFLIFSDEISGFTDTI